MHYTAYIENLDVTRWIILAGGTSLLFGMVHILFRRSDATPRPDGDFGASISADLSTSTIGSGTSLYRAQTVAACSSKPGWRILYGFKNPR
jgi:hypothetical protein